MIISHWEEMVTLFFALTFAFVIILSIGFYVNYKRDQWRRKQAPAQNLVQGRFFRRYIPQELKSKYALYLNEEKS